MQSLVLLAIYCVLIVAASLVGGWLPTAFKLTHRWMQLVMSLVGGFMLGVALLHLIPHSVGKLHDIDHVVGWTLGGLLVMFLLIRVFHVHAHEHGDAQAGDGPRRASLHSQPGHGHACLHDGLHEHAGGTHRFSWLGLAFGLAVHTIIDGLALGAAVAAESHKAGVLALVGVGTFLAVLLHKPLDALSITSLMAAGGWSKSAALAANVVFALMCPLGAIGFVLGLNQLTSGQELVVGSALAFAAGVFLCISLADLLPELTFHAHDRAPLTAALFLGVAAAWAIGWVEAEHVHGGHAHPSGAHEHEHEQDGQGAASEEP
jgi:zinc and cadmium transporter